jgi:hypothetical protein
MRHIHSQATTWLEWVCLTVPWLSWTPFLVHFVIYSLSSRSMQDNIYEANYYFGMWLKAITSLFCCGFWKPLRVGEVLSKFSLILNSSLLIPTMLAKLTQYSCWVTYNDLELVLFNYKLLMVVIKACETSVPNRSVVVTWWLGWMCSMLSCCHEPPFCNSCVLICSNFKVIWKEKIFEASYIFYKLFFYKSWAFFYIYPSTLIMFLFSSCILWFVIHVLIIPLLFLIAVDWTKMPWVCGGRGGRGVTRNLNDFYPRGALDGSETAESSKVGGRRGHKRSPTS